MYNLRKGQRIDYRKMSGRGRASEDQVVLKVDKKAERELVSASEAESSSESKDISDSELDEVDEEELMKMLSEKEQKRDKAKEELEKTKKKALDIKKKEEKRKRITDLLNKIKRVDEETSRIESETSRQNTPATSPELSPKRKHKKYVAHSDSEKKNRESEGKQKVSLLKESMPQVGTPEFVEMVTEALNKGISLTKECESELTKSSGRKDAHNTENQLMDSINSAVNTMNRMHAKEGKLTTDLLFNMLKARKRSANAVSNYNSAKINTDNDSISSECNDKSDSHLVERKQKKKRKHSRKGANKDTAEDSSKAKSYH